MFLGDAGNSNEACPHSFERVSVHQPEGMAVPKLFETTTLAGLALNNRFVRSATWEGMAHEDGTCSAPLVSLMSDLAKGELGLIISGHAFVAVEGKASPWQLAVYDDRFISDLAPMAQAVHAAGSKIVLQLAHAGVQALTVLTGCDAIGPASHIHGKRVLGRPMTVEEIDRTVNAFVAAAARAEQAGFDGVQIHAAHGYLLSQFLSPHFNARTDGYGGSLQNRARIVLKIVERVKQTTPKDFPVLIKINSEDFLEGGLSQSDMLELAAMLETAGIDGIELSGGTADPSGSYSPVRTGPAAEREREAYYVDAARRYKERIGVPLLLVGGIRAFETAERLVEDGVTDYISLSRPLIREPDLVARWKSGDRRASACRSCNRCFKPARAGEGLRCVDREQNQGKECNL